MKKKIILTVRQIRKMSKKEMIDIIKTNDVIMDFKAAQAYREKLKENE